MVHTYNGILLSHKKNEFESVLGRWIKLEPVTQSEVSQSGREKHISYINAYIWNLENEIDEPVCREEMEMQV